MSVNDKFLRINEHFRKKINTTNNGIRDAADAVKEAQNRLSAAKSRNMDARSACYKEKLKLAKELIESEVKTIQCPETYDPAHVAELRKVLADSVYHDTPEMNLNALKALYELQLILKKWPFAVRLATLLSEWTGSKLTTETRTESIYTQTYLLSSRGEKLMLTGDYQIEYRPPSSEQHHFVHNAFSSSNFRTRLFDDHEMMYDVPTCYVEFWEYNCLHMSIDPKFLTCEDEPSIKETDSHRKIYREYLHKVGTVDAVSQYRGFQTSNRYTIKDEDFAAYIIAQHLNMFTFAEVMKCYDKFNEKSQKFILSELTEQIKELNRHLYHTHKDIKLDIKAMEVSWFKSVDETMAFDPDTCEMIHTSIEPQTMSVARAHIDSLYLYVANHHPDVVSKYAPINIILDYAGHSRNGVHHHDSKIKSIAEDYIPPKIAELIDIVKPNIENVGVGIDFNGGRYPRYSFTALPKVPMKTLLAKYKSHVLNDTDFYAQFVIKGTELSKIYFEKDDLD